MINMYCYGTTNILLMNVSYHFVNECIATPLTEYENSRAHQIMKNNQMFQRLGIDTKVSILKNPQPLAEDEGPKKLGSEYEPQENEGCEEEE
jgi:hypothetical protein